MKIWITHHCLEPKYRCEHVQAWPLTQGPVWEAVHELQVRRKGEDVEEVEEDVHSNDGPHMEESMDPDALHLIIFASELLGAHLPGWQTRKGLSWETGWAACSSIQRNIQGPNSALSFRNHTMDYRAEISIDSRRPTGWAHRNTSTGSRTCPTHSIPPRPPSQCWVQQQRGSWITLLAKAVPITGVSCRVGTWCDTAVTGLAVPKGPYVGWKSHWAGSRVLCAFCRDMFRKSTLLEGGHLHRPLRGCKCPYPSHLQDATAYREGHLQTQESLGAGLASHLTALPGPDAYFLARVIWEEEDWWCLELSLQTPAVNETESCSRCHPDLVGNWSMGISSPLCLVQTGVGLCLQELSCLWLL